MLCNPATIRRRLSLASFSSLEDVVAIVVLVLAFSVVAIDLLQFGGWRGCALSAAWCVTYEDPVGQTDGLPAGTWRAQTMAIAGSISALACRLRCLWRHRKHFDSYRLGRVNVAVTLLFLSNLATVSCAVVPMSCGCLHDGVEWVYVSWRDYVHDGSLWTIYASAIASAFYAGYGRKKGKMGLFYLTIFCAVVQSVGIYRCPSSTKVERVALLMFEVLAVALVQFLHYGTIPYLASEAVRNVPSKQFKDGDKSPGAYYIWRDVV